MTKYPERLPLPLQEGYALKPVSPLIRTEMVSGRARQRRRYLSTPSQADVSWLLTEQQAQVFEAWYRDVLMDGAAWFEMPLRTPVGERGYKCRFVDIYDGPVLTGGNYWKFSAQLELWERPILPLGWGPFPDLVLGSDIIDIALNREWPQ